MCWGWAMLGEEICPALEGVEWRAPMILGTWGQKRRGWRALKLLTGARDIPP